MSVNDTLRLLDVCTIIAKNYVAQARVLARSFLEHHPNGRIWTLLIDDFDGLVDPAGEPFDVLTPAEVGCDEFEAMATRYSVLELSTAVKPWLLRHLMRATGSPITYLDPDIKVFGSLDALDRRAARHGVVLTPHNTEPIPFDGRRPSQVDIMIAGIYNLGYVSVAPRPEVDLLLDWWAERLRRDCRVDPVYGYFVDQRWFDLAPGFLSDLAIVRDAEYNVAYWNLHSRTLEHDGQRYRADGRPLAFFHFSGFDPEQPAELSRFQNRVALAGNPALQRICREYAEDAIREGFATAHRWPYGYGSLPGGVPYDEELRRMFAIAEELGEVHGSPFTSEGAASFLEWLAAQQPGAPPGVHRLLAHVYGTRSEVREAFPDLGGGDLGGLLEWTRREGKAVVPALGMLPLPDLAASSGTERPGRASQSAPPPLAEPWGVNVVGYFRSELGVGEAARQMINALDANDVPALPLHGETIPLSRQGHPYTLLDYSDAAYPVNLLCMNADALPEFAHQAGERFFAGRYSIGLWFWEVNQFPEAWIGSFEPLDELWLPSAHVTEAIAAVAPIPTATITIPVEMPAVQPRSRASLGAPDGFLFLFSFDYRSVFERKNPLAVIEAFSRAFAPEDDARLAIKCINADADPVNHNRLLSAVAEHPHVHLIDRYLSPEDNNALTASCDCYVSLHRSEGFGYTMAEAMYCARPVIATGYSGNLEFMASSNSLLVRHRLVRIGDGADPYPAEGEWAEPDVQHAAELMRMVYEDPQFAAELGQRAAHQIRRTHSARAAGELIVRRLETVRASRNVWARGAAARREPLVGSLAARVARGESVLARKGPAPRVARRAALHAMRLFSRYQERVNAEVVRTLAAVDEQLEQTRLRQLRANAAMLAGLRRLESLRTAPAILESHGQAIAELRRAVPATRFETDRAVYLAVSELRRVHAAIGDSPREAGESGELTPWELRAFSQNGEDGVLAAILARIGAPTRYFVEFGVETGREGNCIFLADVADWCGLFIEAEQQRFSELERKYRVADRITTVRERVTPENIQRLFERAGVPAEPDVLSIDVDGQDYWIWDAISDYRPRVVVIEYNAILDPTRRLVQPRDQDGWDGTDFFGASLGAIQALGERKGYQLVHTELSGLNAFLVREELAGGRFPSSDEVPVRGLPNYFQSGYRHPRDPHRRRYLDLDTGEMEHADRRTRSVPASPTT